MNFWLLLISPILSYAPLFLNKNSEQHWYCLIVVLALIIIIENVVGYRLRTSPVKRGKLKELLEYRMLFWVTRMSFLILDAILGYHFEYTGYEIMYASLIPVCYILNMGYQILFKITDGTPNE